MDKQIENWYLHWFDSDFYPILYEDRNHREAQEFMHNITGYLNLSPGAHILDLACGRGRHSIYLNEMGYRVTGIDLSENAITHARKKENENLRFLVHDMTEPMTENYDAVFNLFTSFGYFEKEESNLKTIKAIRQNLNVNGYGVIDFMNTQKVLNNLIPENEITRRGITFRLKRYVQDKYIYKEIRFEHQGQDYHFTERVRALELEDFKQYFQTAGMNLLQTFGDYQLNEFDRKDSDRLIMIFR
ncbi:class I SAM-dependent methyltransferase [Robertkochia aurantiaca]|uniref:class I SAM-dependent methyltransferase n=1 Tax=Robertkochia aurantiaca TaxID=2873700 RepID=UPI001CCF17FE|nr:class I SAM-dependent methyltransferase [Robertkochia sp. 3YJGBD-33]